MFSNYHQEQHSPGESTLKKFGNILAEAAENCFDEFPPEQKQPYITKDTWDLIQHKKFYRETFQHQKRMETEKLLRKAIEKDNLTEFFFFTLSRRRRWAFVFFSNIVYTVYWYGYDLWCEKVQHKADPKRFSQGVEGSRWEVWWTEWLKTCGVISGNEHWWGVERVISGVKRRRREMLGIWDLRTFGKWSIFNWKSVSAGDF